MEDVLAVYMRPHDPDQVLVCLDESSKQLIAETRVPISMRPGSVARVDYEYERNGDGWSNNKIMWPWTPALPWSTTCASNW